jgi:hypothetical protein
LLLDPALSSSLGTRFSLSLVVSLLDACGRAAADYGERVDDEGYDTAEGAARGDIPERYARILRID